MTSVKFGSKSPTGKSVVSKEYQPILVWNKKVSNTELEKFSKLIEQKFSKSFGSYWDLHKWSIENIESFWEEVWNYFNVVYSKPYDKIFVRTGEGFLDNEWFPGVRFNFAENLLRIRDEREAMLYFDEMGNEDIVTFAQMFKEVTLYAAAFRKHGVQKEDRVACYMSNRKEAIFAFLAALSIGAIFGGPLPYFETEPSWYIIKKMEAKVLIAIDYHIDNGETFENIDKLPEIVNNCSTLEKVLIVATKPETKTRDLSDIPTACLLDEFLDSGRNPDGTVPDIEFQQLPFCHPISINFSSGTTGHPKGTVHSAGTLISSLSSIVFDWNLKCGDVVYTCYPVGWSLWDTFVPCLAWGVKLFLHGGCPYGKSQGMDIWDLCSKYKVTHAFLRTVFLDKLERMNIVPKPTTNLENLKFLTTGASPVKVQNILFIKNKIKKDVFPCSHYGTTETFGSLNGFDLNLPCYAGEIQAPGLGMDIRCFDDNGDSVLNKRGEMVLVTPTPSLPIYIWQDVDHRILKETFLSKYPGVWCLNDEIWINPVTKGYVVVGRSGDAIPQGEELLGASDIYAAIHGMEEIQDYICVGQKRLDEDARAVLFVKMKEGYTFTLEFKKKIQQKIFDELGLVPRVILEAKDVPYNLNNKKMESLVRRIVATNQVPEVNNVKNPECLISYCDIPEIIDFNKI